MFRLTILLIAGLGLAMFFADSFPEGPEKAIAFTVPEPVIVEEAPKPNVQTAVVANAPAETAPEPEIPETATTAVATAINQPSYLDLFQSPAVVGPDGKLEIKVIEAEETPAATTALQTTPDPSADTLANVWFVTGERVNVREGPTTSAPVVEQVIYAEAVQVLTEPVNGWVMIRIEGDGVEGYMANRFLQEIDPEG